MTYEVVVVGAGLGGLTTAALLSARGMNVCVLEKESRGGGCAGIFAHAGYEFEMGAGLYACWQPEEIHARVFRELPIEPPEVRASSHAYVVRLPDGTDVRVGGSIEEFEANLRAAFPECAGAATAFYRELSPIADALRQSFRQMPHLLHVSKLQRMKWIASEPRMASRILAAQQDTTAQHLKETSTRFRRFIDVQLQLYAQCASDECAYLYAARALIEPLRGMYQMRGGANALTDALVESIQRTGGRVRFDTTALRLAYDAGGRVNGVDLLSGERVTATRAIISNLTVWDTYGKLVGLNRTSPELRARLRNLRGWGAYLLYLGMDEEAASRLASERMLVLNDWQEGCAYDAESAQFMFSASPVWDTRRAPAGKRAVTVSTFTNAEQWFAYHEDEDEHESQDQLALERCWEQLHRALPELGAGVEVIETATPRTFYEQTRRKLGMIGGLGQTLSVFGANAFTHRTPLQNLYMVGDTVFPGQGVAAVTCSALIVADEIAPRKS